MQKPFHGRTVKVWRKANYECKSEEVFLNKWAVSFKPPTTKTEKITATETTMYVLLYKMKMLEI